MRTAFTAGDRNRGLGTSRFTYGRCRSCRSLTLLDPPEDLEAFYAGDYHRVPEEEDLERAAAQERHKRDVLDTAGARSPLIEVGSGWGGFAHLAVKAGFEVTCLEMSEECCAFLRERVGVRAVCTEDPARDLEELPSAATVAMWHVIEHVQDPWALLDAAAGNVGVGGHVIVGTPNPDSLGLRLLGGRWAHVDAPRHLHLISAGAMIDRARQLGLEPVRLTTADGGQHLYNDFAWRSVLRARGLPAPVRLAGLALQPLVTVLGRLLAPVERRSMRGAAYTLVLRRAF